MSKTVMQSHLEWLEVRISISQQQKDLLLKKERQQFIDAVMYGTRQEFYDGTETTAEQYYNLKFKDNETDPK